MAFEHAKQCKRIAKSTGKQCGNPAVTGADYCRMHSGTSPIHKKGLEHPSTKHGRYSKHIPSGLLERYNAAQSDSDILDLRENVALIDTRIMQLLERVDIGDFSKRYETLTAQYKKALRLLSQQNFIALETVIVAMGDVIEEGNAEFQVWDELRTFNNDRAKIVKTVADIEYKGENAIRVTELMVLMARMLDAFERANQLDDAKERKRIMRSEMQKIINFENVS